MTHRAMIRILPGFLRTLLALPDTMEIVDGWMERGELVVVCSGPDCPETGPNGEIATITPVYDETLRPHVTLRELRVEPKE